MSLTLQPARHGNTQAQEISESEFWRPVPRQGNLQLHNGLHRAAIRVGSRGRGLLA
ncbi:hypothetical protein ACTMU2_01770 [Cupriavidus basilensis]